MSLTTFGGSVVVHRIEWTSDGSGDATETVHIDGEILRVVTDPSGSAAPTDDYDITFVDEDGLDIMAGGLANRDTANTEAVVPSARVVHYGDVTVTVANAGASKSGVVKVYVR